MKKNIGQILLAIIYLLPCGAFQAGFTARHTSALREGDQWTGEVVNDEDGRIRGCIVTPGVSETDFTIQIDGNEADLGNFGSVVYRKITSDAKRQQYQGFRPGTLPPHLLPTYKSFAMDEVAREAILEAMQQNNIRPFESARVDMLIEQVSIPPKPKKKKKGKKKKKANAEPQAEPDAPIVWETFDTMDEALKAGWEVSSLLLYCMK